MANVDIETHENSFLTTGYVQGNEIVKAEDFNYSFQSLISNMSKFSKMIFEAEKDFVIGGQVSVYNGLNLKVAPLFGVCHDTGIPFGMAEEISGLSISVPSGTSDRIDILEVKGEMVEFETQQRAFNDLDNDTITYQKVKTKSGMTLNFVVKQGSAGAAPDTDAGFVKLCEIHYPANASELDDSDIYNITSDVSTEENEEWTNESDSVYNIGYISDVNERFREQHEEDGTHKENIITTKELDIGGGSTQIGGHTLPSGGTLKIADSSETANSSLLQVLTTIAAKITNLFNSYLKYGAFNFNGELSISDILDDDKTGLAEAIKIGTDTNEDDERFAYVKFGDKNILTITSDGIIRMETGYEATATTDLITKSVTDALSLLISTLKDRVDYLYENMDPTAATNRVLSKFEASSLQVKVVSDENIELSGTPEIDGVTVSSGEYVIVNGQTDKKENGIWQVTDAGWVRYEGQIPQRLFHIESGIKYGGYTFFSLYDNFVIGEDNIEFLKCIYSKTAKNNTVMIRDENGVAFAKKPTQNHTNPSDAVINMKFLADVLYPVGFVYTQWPLCPSPIDMNLYGTWQEISQKYAGLSARVSGGNAEQFERILEVTAKSGTTITLPQNHKVTTGSLIVDIGNLKSDGEYDGNFEQRSVVSVNENVITLDSEFTNHLNLRNVLICQNDQFQGHTHNFTHYWNRDWQSAPCSGGNGATYASQTTRPVSDGVNGTPRTGNETRSKNTTVRLWKRTN